MDRGIKRHCFSCKSYFYDLNRHPVYCPKCHKDYEITSASGMKKYKKNNSKKNVKKNDQLKGITLIKEDFFEDCLVDEFESADIVEKDFLEDLNKEK